MKAQKFVLIMSLMFAVPALAGELICGEDPSGDASRLIEQKEINIGAVDEVESFLQSAKEAMANDELSAADKKDWVRRTDAQRLAVEIHIEASKKAETVLKNRKGGKELTAYVQLLSTAMTYYRDLLSVMGKAFAGQDVKAEIEAVMAKLLREKDALQARGASVTAQLRKVSPADIASGHQAFQKAFAVARCQALYKRFSK